MENDVFEFTADVDRGGPAYAVYVGGALVYDAFEFTADVDRSAASFLPELEELEIIFDQGESVAPTDEAIVEPVGFVTPEWTDMAAETNVDVGGPAYAVYVGGALVYDAFA